ncbi:NAD(P)/FAD-dependent oxidoreductase [Ramlibacter sp.]|uniref:NAD(P)/FAD-dependent oxidoreductase n=1 Tax=Ramlibacter sp. TaxID=1917967 RepID=UPI002D543B7C|nr:NAD(P)/FAD-dependent oxidoreductase [Ramlibacter sp.]HYD75054.1 NAD(P)/FAD-dependent oxidoreductase [Ramlibacter sp.]
MSDEVLDCLVIGGGPAGLVAGVYLARFRRRLRLVDAGDCRLATIPRSHNVPGYPDGVAGAELLRLLRDQAARYQVPVEDGRVDRLGGEDGDFEAHCGDRVLRARKVLLATGARDVVPEVPGIEAGLAAGNVRYCPVCDGFETQGQRVAVLGRREHGLREALFLAGFDNQVTWLSLGTQHDVPPQELAQLRERSVLVADGQPLHIRCLPGEGVEVEMVDGRQLGFDVLYPALGLKHACELATRLGAQAGHDGQLVVDQRLQTTVPGLYVAGDVAAGLNQISVAWGHAAIAATAIHNALPLVAPRARRP